MGHFIKTEEVTLKVKLNSYYLKCDRCDKPEEHRIPFKEVLDINTPYDIFDNEKDKLKTKQYVSLTINGQEVKILCAECWDEVYHAL